MKNDFAERKVRKDVNLVERIVVCILILGMNFLKGYSYSSCERNLCIHAFQQVIWVCYGIRDTGFNPVFVCEHLVLQHYEEKKLVIMIPPEPSLHGFPLDAPSTQFVIKQIKFVLPPIYFGICEDVSQRIFVHVQSFQRDNIFFLKQCLHSL